MRKNLIQKINVHITDETDIDILNDKFNEFYANIIKCRLSALYITKDQKLKIIDKIITNLKSHEA